MCKSKKMTSQVIEPKPSSSSFPTSTRLSRRSSEPSPLQRPSLENSTSGNHKSNSSSYDYYRDSWKSSVSSQASFSSLRDSLFGNPHIYDFSEVRTATNNFLPKPFSKSSASTSWRCSVRGDDVIVFQRKFRRPIESSEELRERLLLICRSHHSSLVPLRGASISGNYIYLVYDYVHGASLSDCLWNQRNPNFTVLSKWMYRIQIAADIAHGLDYIHHSTGLNISFVHNHIKSSSIIITEPSLNAKICHFGTAEISGEIPKEKEKDSNSIGKAPNFKRSGSGGLKFEGTRGYMSPEFQISGVPTQKSDVFAFGVVVLELVSGNKALRYVFDDASGGYARTSVIEMAREAMDGGGGGVRGWVDKRLKDSYPVEVAEGLVRVGLDCVEEDPNKRPDMDSVALRISKLYLESKGWAEKFQDPADFSAADISVSLAVR